MSHLTDLRMTVGQCPQLEVLVFQDCSIVPDWRSQSLGSHIKVISRSVDHLQLLNLQISVGQLVDFISLFRDLHCLEMDRCDLDLSQLKGVLLDQPLLHTLKCSLWTHSSLVQQSRMADLQGDFRHVIHVQLT